MSTILYLNKDIDTIIKDYLGENKYQLRAKRALYNRVMEEYNLKYSMDDPFGFDYTTLALLVNGILIVIFNRRYKHWVDYESEYEQSELCMVL